MANSDGVVGVQWYAMKHEKEFDLYFAGSIDGGATFSTPMRISTAPSNEPANEARYPGQDQVYGDAAADGSFRLVWTDARNHAPGYVTFCRTARVSHSPAEHPLQVSIDGFAGTFEAGATIPLTAAAPPAGQEFASWQAPADVAIADPAHPITSATLPPAADGPLVITSIHQPARRYTLTVTGGSGSGLFPAGAMVPITATPPAAGAKFATWQNAPGIGFLQPTSAATQLEMPEHDVMIAATWKE